MHIVMKIVAHCFAENASITPNKIDFKFKEYNATIFSIDNKLTLQISKILTADELIPFSEKLISPDVRSDNIEEKMELRLRPYKLILTEIAQLFEGLFSLMYASVPPHFNTAQINVNLFSETEDELQRLNEGNISRGGGYMLMPDKRNYQINDAIFNLISPSLDHLPAFSFFSHALRSLKSNDNEVAFFLFFRVIDGYFSFGAKDVEKELIKKEADLNRLIPYEGKIINSLKIILTEMNLPSKGGNNFKGLIRDLVLIRHKLTHFSSTKAKNHHSPNIKFELLTVNTYLYNCCFNLLREKIASKEI
jgi:hypothetical protein